jgi:hypothetical protein
MNDSTLHDEDLHDEDLRNEERAPHSDNQPAGDRRRPTEGKHTSDE